MNKLIKILSISLICGATFLAMSSLPVYSQTVQSSKGTLYGNDAGTKFCCGSGTSSCSAAACKTSGSSQR